MDVCADEPTTPCGPFSSIDEGWQYAGRHDVRKAMEGSHMQAEVRARHFPHRWSCCGGYIRLALSFVWHPGYAQSLKRSPASCWETEKTKLTHSVVEHVVNRWASWRHRPRRAVAVSSSSRSRTCL